MGSQLFKYFEGTHNNLYEVFMTESNSEHSYEVMVNKTWFLYNYNLTDLYKVLTALYFL